MTAAYHAARRGGRVLLVDRKRPPGEKLLLSGGGRCNVLPQEVDPRSFTTDSSPHTLRKILLSWPLTEVRAFLEGPIRLRLTEDRRTGKVFPVTGGGREVRDRLLAAARDAGAELRAGATVVDVDPSERRSVLLQGGERLVADRVVLASGGLSYPQTGSDGLGLEIARRLGHTLVEPYPALVPLRSRDSAHHALAGVSIDALLRVGEGKGHVEARGGFLFTHRGYSGPVVLNLSHAVSRALLRGDRPSVTVSWLDRTEDDWEARLARSRRRTVRAFLEESLPDRLADLLLRETDLSDARTATLGRTDRRRLLHALVSYPLPWRRTEGFDVAEVTGGGIPLGETSPRTLESRIAPRVRFCGEILDAFGPIGGANFLWAFVTGRLAGEGAVS